MSWGVYAFGMVCFLGGYIVGIWVAEGQARDRARLR